MRYILDDNGYIDSISCTPFECKDKGCTEYTGTIPEGYSSLEEWATTANIRAYKIVNGNLTFDGARDTALQAEWDLQRANKGVILYNNTNGANGTLALSDNAADYEYVEIIYRDNNGKQGGYTKLYTRDVSFLDFTLSMIEASSSTDCYIRRTRYTGWTKDKQLIPDSNTTGYTLFSNSSVSTYFSNGYNYLYVIRVIGYR